MMEGSLGGTSSTAFCSSTSSYSPPSASEGLAKVSSVTSLSKSLEVSSNREGGGRVERESSVRRVGTSLLATSTIAPGLV